MGLTLEELKREIFECGFTCTVRGGLLEANRPFSEEVIEEFNLIEGFYDDDDGDDENGKPIIRKIYSYKQR